MSKFLNSFITTAVIGLVIGFVVCVGQVGSVPALNLAAFGFLAGGIVNGFKELCNSQMAENDFNLKNFVYGFLFGLAGSLIGLLLL